ncbi:MAG: transposase [Clostridiales bacterium]|nr:transposase [Clostridiales bacterium]
MRRKTKFSYETKIAVVQRCLIGKSNSNYEALLLGISPTRVREWITVYDLLGDLGLITSSKNSVYSAALKQCIR